MHLVRIAVASLTVVAVGACASRVSVPPWSALQLQIEEQLVGNAEPPPTADERAVLRSALAHAHPQSPLYDRELAQERLRQLVEVYPRSGNVSFAGYLLPLLAEVDRWERRYEESELEVLQHRRQAEELTERFESVEDERRQAARLAASHREEVQRLTQEIRTRDERIQELEITLQRLVNIDLRPSE